MASKKRLSSKSQEYKWRLGAKYSGAAFVIFTLLISFVDVKPIGPGESEVGFSIFNELFFQKYNRYYNADWDGVTDKLLYAGLAIVVVAYLYAFWQFIQRKSIQKIDKDILVIDVAFAAMVAFYCFFELVVINCRPRLEADGTLEASYPSSHIFMGVTIFCCFMFFFDRRLPMGSNKRNMTALLGCWYSVEMIWGRVKSGVHWITDIIGGVLLAAFLLCSVMAALKHFYEDYDKARVKSYENMRARIELEHHIKVSRKKIRKTKLHKK